MGYFFSSHEIAEMAMHVEEAGIEFHKKASEFAADEKIKKIFLFLSNAEIDHRNIFRGIMEAEEKNDSLDEYSIDIASNIEYLIGKFEKAVFDLKFPEVSSLTIAKCLDVGIHVESGLITAYTELHEVLIGKFYNVLEKIIGEEKTHLEMLQNIKKKLSL
ncbi:MAG: ferritin family protein [Candidatus Omnitrophota bacterium]